MRITCLFHRINFGFMTPGPPPRRPVRGRASRSDVAGQSKLCTARTDEPRGACVPPSRPPKHAEAQSAGGTVVRQGGGGRHPRMVTSRDGVPRQPRQGTSAARRRGPRPTGIQDGLGRLGTVQSQSGSPPPRPGRALPLRCVPLAGGAGVSWSGVTGRETSRAGRARRHAAETVVLWRGSVLHRQWLVRKILCTE